MSVGLPLAFFSNKCEFLGRPDVPRGNVIHKDDLFLVGEKLLSSIKSAIMPPGAKISYRYKVFTSPDGAFDFQMLLKSGWNEGVGGALFGNKRLTDISNVLM